WTRKSFLMRSNNGCLAAAVPGASCARCPRSLAADGAEDEVRGEADDEAAEYAPGDERLVPEPRIHLHELDDHVEDRSRGEGDEVAPRAAVVDGGVKRVLDRADAVLENVVEQEQQDPGRRGAERRLQGEAAVLDPTDRQADEDGRARDGAQQQDL